MSSPLKKQSYGSILHSTSLIGGAEVVKLLIGLFQLKFVALFLGPVGIGLIGTYQSIINLIHQFSSLGIAGSGVREISLANGSGDSASIGRSVLTLKRMSWLTGTAGALILVFFSTSISNLTFGSEEYAPSLVCLAWIILIRQIMNAQISYIQGIRRIGDLARLKIIGSFGGGIIGVGFYAWFGIDGIVPALITLALFSLASSSWYARKSSPPKVNMSWTESFRESKGLMQLGVALMIGGLCSPFLAYWTRVLIMQQSGLDAVGIFQSSFRLSALFVNFVLQAMGADYLPRLTAASLDSQKMRSIVNEQTEIGFLLAVPGLLVTLSCAPWMIHFFYTGEFLQSAELLKWFVMGCFFRVISFPLGYVLTATARKKLYIYVQVLFTTLHLILIWIGLNIFGIVGSAIAFFILYLTHLITLKLMMSKIINFSWSARVIKLFIILLPIAFGMFITTLLLPGFYTSCLGLLTSLLTSIYCVRELSLRVGSEHKIFKIIGRIPGVSRFLLPTIES